MQDSSKAVIKIEPMRLGCCKLTANDTSHNRNLPPARKATPAIAVPTQIVPRRPSHGRSTRYAPKKFPGTPSNPFHASITYTEGAPPEVPVEAGADFSTSLINCRKFAMSYGTLCHTSFLHPDLFFTHNQSITASPHACKSYEPARERKSC